ncbi:hypothetical protein J6590_050205 [Homalodisca vitripennis]|nr:hypothetical protein J6590_050205 [Homalodisca vitripennis]
MTNGKPQLRKTDNLQLKDLEQKYNAWFIEQAENKRKGVWNTVNFWGEKYYNHVPSDSKEKYKVHLTVLPIFQVNSVSHCKRPSAVACTNFFTSYLSCDLHQGIIEIMKFSTPWRTSEFEFLQ